MHSLRCSMEKNPNSLLGKQLISNMYITKSSVCFYCFFLVLHQYKESSFLKMRKVAPLFYFQLPFANREVADMQRAGSNIMSLILHFPVYTYLLPHAPTYTVR